LPAPRLPFVCRVKELAALVLLPVSACNVVEGAGTGLVGAEGAEGVLLVPPPQAVSDQVIDALAT